MRYWIFQWYEGETGKQVEYSDKELQDIYDQQDGSDKHKLTFLELKDLAMNYFHNSENINVSMLQGSVGFSVELRQEDITATVKQWAGA